MKYKINNKYGLAIKSDCNISFMLRKIAVKWFSDSAEIVLQEAQKEENRHTITMSKLELENFIDELENLNNRLDY